MLLVGVWVFEGLGFDLGSREVLGLALRQGVLMT